MNHMPSDTLCLHLWFMWLNHCKTAKWPTFICFQIQNSTRSGYSNKLSDSQRFKNVISRPGVMHIVLYVCGCIGQFYEGLRSGDAHWGCFWGVSSIIDHGKPWARAIRVFMMVSSILLKSFLQTGLATWEEICVYLNNAPCHCLSVRSSAVIIMSNAIWFLFSPARPSSIGISDRYTGCMTLWHVYTAYDDQRTQTSPPTHLYMSAEMTWCFGLSTERYIKLQPNTFEVRFSCTFPIQYIEQLWTPTGRRPYRKGWDIVSCLRLSTYCMKPRWSFWADLDDSARKKFVIGIRRQEHRHLETVPRYVPGIVVVPSNEKVWQ